MSLARQSLGREGETRAARFLETRGYRIIARNVRADRVEIDLIARRGSLLVFIEVKTRRATAHGVAAEAVDSRKQRRLRRGARAWLATNPAEGRGARRRRFDVVTCICDKFAGRPPNEATPPSLEDWAGWSIEHWEGAF